MRRLVLVLAVLALVLAACANGNAPGVSTSGTQSGNAIEIKDSAFSPADLETPAGTEVSWSNNDGMTHQIVADDGSFDSGQLEDMGVFRYTFKTAGAYKYHCSMHPSETGTVTLK